MLATWGTKMPVTFDGKTYDVLAVSPTFDESLGTQAPGVPYWGTGEGSLKVTYQDTSRDFWNLVEQHRPCLLYTSPSPRD